MLHMLQAEDVKVVLTAIRAVHRICSHILDSGDLTMATESLAHADNAG